MAWGFCKRKKERASSRQQAAPTRSNQAACKCPALVHRAKQSRMGQASAPTRILQLPLCRHQLAVDLGAHHGVADLKPNGAVAGGAGKYKRGRAGHPIAADPGSNRRETQSNGQYCITHLRSSSTTETMNSVKRPLNHTKSPPRCVCGRQSQPQWRPLAAAPPATRCREWEREVWAALVLRHP